MDGTQDGKGTVPTRRGIWGKGKRNLRCPASDTA